MNTFDEKTHSYLIDGKPATGITTIISVLAKPALIQWSANEAVKYIQNNVAQKEVDGIPYWLVQLHDLEQAKTAHRKKKEDAGVHGTDTHALVENYVNACIDKNKGRPRAHQHDECMECTTIKKFVDWANENVDHFLFAERKMFNKDLFIAGTCDFAYVDKQGKRVISDFKTSSNIYYEMWIQTAGYKFLAEAEGDEKYDYRSIVKLGKKGEFDFQVRYDNDTDTKAFMACLELYRATASYK